MLLHLRLLLPQEASLLELQYWVSWTKICRGARTDEQTASVRKMPTTFPSSAPASDRASERKSGELITAPERRWSGPPLYTLSMPVLAMNESTEWLQVTIITKVPFYLHIHRQTDHSAPHRVRTQTQRAPRAAAAPLRAKGKNWGHWWGERGRQAGSEGGRKGERREGGSGDECGARGGG